MSAALTILADETDGLRRVLVLDKKQQPLDFYAERVAQPDQAGLIDQWQFMQKQGLGAFMQNAQNLRGFWPESRSKGAASILQIRASAKTALTYGSDKAPTLTHKLAFASAALALQTDMPKAVMLSTQLRLSQPDYQPPLSLTDYQPTQGAFAKASFVVRRGALALTAAQLKAEAEWLLNQSENIPIAAPSLLLRAIRDYGYSAAAIIVAKAALANNMPPSLATPIQIKPEPLAPYDERIASWQQAEVKLPQGGQFWLETTALGWCIDIDCPPDKAADALLLATTQIKLRNLSGMILIDLPGAPQGKAAEKALSAAKAALAQDPAGAEIYYQPRLGLVQISRTRRHASLPEVLHHE